MLRWKRIGALAVALTFCTVLVCALWPLPHRVTEKNANWLQVGMSRADVEAILGPPGDYRTGSTVSPYALSFGPSFGPVTEERGGYSVAYWWSDEVYVGVLFIDDRLYGEDILPCVRGQQSGLDNLGWPVERLWRNCFR